MLLLTVGIVTGIVVAVVGILVLTVIIDNRARNDPPHD